MSNSYKIVSGDTFAGIARKVYGYEDPYAQIIAGSNPGVFEPLTAGTTIVVPDAPGNDNTVNDEFDPTSDEVTVFIRGQRFEFWNRIALTLSMDSAASFTLGAPFDFGDTSMRESFRPMRFDPIRIAIGGETFLTGTMVDVNPGYSVAGNVVACQGYSKPGVLMDCPPPASMAPLEFDNQNLQQIADRLLQPFGIKAIFLSEAGAAFGPDRVACDPSQTVWKFLAGLAAQKELVMSADSDGNLIFQKQIETGSAVTFLQSGQPPLLSVSPKFKPQQYFSHITGVQPPSFEFLPGEQYTVKNDRLDTVIRPHVFQVPDMDGGDLKAAVETKAGRMFANAVSYNVTVNTWRDPFGNLWKPNTNVELTAPEAMIYNDLYEFTIRSVTFTKANNQFFATLNLVLPGSFSGKIPEIMPWD